MTNEKLHLETKLLAEKYVQAEQKLFGALLVVQKREAYRDFGFKVLFTYAVKHLGLTEAVAQSYRLVVNQALSLPPLNEAICSGKLSVAYASRIVSGLSPQNVDEVINYAASHSVRETERWLVDEKAIVRSFKISVTTETRELMRQVKDILPGNSSDDETLKKALQEYLERHHPVQKAKRAADRAARSTSVSKASKIKTEQSERPIGNEAMKPKEKRQPLTAAQKHAVNFKDEHRCVHRDSNGERCRNNRWLHIHHLVPVSEGGSNDPENLITLCPEHHDLVHQMSFPIEQQRNWLSTTENPMNVHWP